jgi:hypothetical protein
MELLTIIVFELKSLKNNEKTINFHNIAVKMYENIRVMNDALRVSVVKLFAPLNNNNIENSYIRF